MTKKLFSLFTLLLVLCASAWALNDVTLVNSNFTQWKSGATPPENTGLKNKNTYTMTDGTNDIADVVGSGCKLNDTNNTPTATGITGYNTNKFRFGSSGNYLNITPNDKFYYGGKVRLLISSQKTDKSTLGTINIGDTKLGDIKAYDAAATCDWQDYDIPSSVTNETATITITRTDATLFLWGVIILTNTSSFTISYNANGGSGDAMANTTGTNLTISTNSYTPPIGYTFAGWNTASDGSGTAYTAGQENVNANLTLYAQWTRTITLNSNGGSKNGSATALYHGTALKGTITHATHDASHGLTGYYTATTAGTKVLNADGSFASTNVSDYISSGKWIYTEAEASNLTLYAQWTATHAVTVESSNDSWGSAAADDDNVAEGETTDITATANSGYKFVNWTVDDDDNGASLDDSEATSTTLTMGTADVTVTANFRALHTYAITYNAGSASGVTGSRSNDTKTEDTDFKLPSAVFTLSGYTQTGWATSDGGPKAYDLGATYSENEKLDLFPVWTVKYTITFNMNGHGSAIAPQELVGSGKKATEPYVADLNDFYFAGWYTNEACTSGNEFDFSETVTASHTLYAKWVEETCSFRQSLSKVVLKSTSAGDVSGFNGGEYAGIEVIAGLSGTATAEVDASHDNVEAGYKLNSGGSSKVFATLKKGTFQEGDRVIVTITKINDTREVDGSKEIMDIYYGSSSTAVKLATIKGVKAAGSYSYRLTAENAAAINSAEKKSIGIFRQANSDLTGKGQNHYVYSVEITGCRNWSHTITATDPGYYATFCAPYKVSVPTGVEAYTARYSTIDANTGQLTLDAWTNADRRVIPANLPVILKGNSTSIVLTATDADVDNFSGTNNLKGTPSAALDASTVSTAYVLGVVNETTGFYKKASGTIPVNKAYIIINDGAIQAPQVIRIVEGENNATNIENVEGNENVVKFIENGQLFIKKNGVIYDAMGRAIR